MMREKIKSFILVILILGSFIQVGILWDYNGHGLPINFLYSFASRSVHSSEKALKERRAEVISPYRIMVSAGLEEPHWILNSGTEFQNEYEKLWTEAQYYLKSILNSENIINESSMHYREWDELSAKKGVFFEFKSAFKPGAFAYFLDIAGSQGGDLESIQKILISPWDDINYNFFSVYISDGSSKLKKYIIQAKTSNLKKSYYDELLLKLGQKSESGSVRSYSIIKDTKNTVLYPARKDIPIIIEGGKFEYFSSLNWAVPENLLAKNGQKFGEIEKKFDSILGSEKDTYDISGEINGSVTVKNLNNIYRFYPDGVMQYKNLSNSADNEKLVEGRAYKNALEFIEKMKLLPANADLYLSSVEEEKDRLRITFDYKIGGLPLLVNYNMEAREKTNLRNAITIEVNNKRVISCWWVLRNFEWSKEKKEYNVNFVDLMDKTFKDYAELKNDKNFTLKDSFVGYEASNGDKYMKLEPVWFVVTENGDSYPVKMVSKKGE